VRWPKADRASRGSRSSKGGSRKGQPQQQGRQSETAKALANAAAQMQLAARMLERGEDPGQVGQVQQEVQEALNAAAQAMLASMQAMRNQDQAQGKMPGAAGTGTRGSRNLAEEGLPESAMMLSEDWGKLPGEVKNQILQAMSEGYPKEFEKMIQVYFKGLAETSEANETN